MGKKFAITPECLIVLLCILLCPLCNIVDIGRRVSSILVSYVCRYVYFSINVYVSIKKILKSAIFKLYSAY